MMLDIREANIQDLAVGSHYVAFALGGNIHGMTSFQMLSRCSASARNMIAVMYQGITNE